MNLLELKEHVDALVDLGHGECKVLITLSEKSVGARAYVGIKGIFTGIDFESGQERIEPVEPVCKRGRTKDDTMKINIFTFSSPRKFYACPICEERVKKDSHYCSRCGQHLIFDPQKEPTDYWEV